jgi:hypothetical protein
VTDSADFKLTDIKKISITKKNQMTQEEMTAFVGQRIESVKTKEVNPKLNNINGILLHFISDNLLDTNPIDWTNKDHTFKVTHSFRRFSELDTVHSDLGDRIVGYTPDREYYICFQNGIIEVFKGPIETQNSLNRQVDYTNIDHLFYAIRNFMDASQAIHKKLFKTIPPYNVFITLIGVGGTYFASFYKNYVTIKPFPSNNARFQPFVLNDIDGNLMKDIIAGVHYGIRASVEWTKLS